MTRYLAPGMMLGMLLPTVVEAQADRSRDIVVTGAPDPVQAATDLGHTPGGTALIPDSAFKDTPVQTIKDILEYTPGVIVQPRFGDDARVSIRGSGLSRAYGTRGITLLLDGVPMNTSDGLLDFFEVDPSAYRYVEVYKGSNALRYGANALGGAINLVTPTGRDAAVLDARIDAGSFGYLKAQASTGGASGALDWFATLSGQRIDGYREHSWGDALRGNLNVGYRISPDLESRVYFTAASTNQRIPGEVTRGQALASPRAANAIWVAQDQQRNVNSVRVASKTTLRLGSIRLEGGAFYNARQVRHPIYQWLDYTVGDYGLFARAADERALGPIRNRLILGANLQNGRIDTAQYLNVGDAVKGALASAYVDRSSNLSFYGEDALHVRPNLALIAGLQFLHARRERRDRFLADGAQSGMRRYALWSPRAGVLWEASADAQAFANVSQSAEVPTYDANSFATPAASDLRAQRATTIEIGSRGMNGSVRWDVSVYRSAIRDELQCLTTGPFSPCSIINAGRTVHQGVEVGLDAAVGRDLRLTLAYTLNDFVFDDDPRYGDNRLPGVPEHYLRAELLYRHPGGAFAGPNLEWSPRSYFADNANTEGLEVPSFALLNLKAGYDAAGWTVYVEGRNLTDRHYISTVAVAGSALRESELFNSGVGRAVFAGLRRRFGGGER